MRNRLPGFGLFMAAFFSVGVVRAEGFIKSGLEFTAPNLVQEYVCSIVTDSMGNIYAVGWETIAGVSYQYAQKWTSSLQQVWRHDGGVGGNIIGFGTGIQTRAYDGAIINSKLVIVGKAISPVDMTNFDGFIAYLDIDTGNLVAGSVKYTPGTGDGVNDCFYGIAPDPLDGTIAWVTGAFPGGAPLAKQLRVEKYYLTSTPPTPGAGENNTIGVLGVDYAGYTIRADNNYVYVGGKSSNHCWCGKFNKTAALPNMWAKESGPTTGDGLHRLAFDSQGDIVGVEADGLNIYHFSASDGAYQQHNVDTAAGLGEPITAGLVLDESRKSFVSCAGRNLYVLDEGSFAKTWTRAMEDGQDQLKDLVFLPNGRLVTGGSWGNPDVHVIVWDRIPTAVFTVTPTALAFRVAKNSTSYPSLTLNVQDSTTTESQSIVWTAVSDKSWLTLSKTSSTLAAGGSDSITVTASPATDNTGRLTATIVVTGTPSTNGSATVYVTVTIYDDTPATADVPMNTLKILGNRLDMSDPNRVMPFKARLNPNTPVTIEIYDSAGRWIGKLTDNTDGSGISVINFRNRLGELSGNVVLGPGIYWAVLNGGGAKKKPFVVILGAK